MGAVDTDWGIPAFAQNMVKLVQEGNGGTAKNVILSL